MRPSLVNPADVAQNRDQEVRFPMKKVVCTVPKRAISDDYKGENSNGRPFVENINTELGSGPYQRSWILDCSNCGHEFEINSSNWDLIECPKCLGKADASIMAAARGGENNWRCRRSYLGDFPNSSEGTYDTVTITTSKLLMCPNRPAAILLTGHRRPNEPYSVAFEVTHEMLSILRTEIEKAERYLSMPTGIS